MANYRKKPVEIEAVQWNGENFDELADLVDGLEGKVTYDESDMSLKIKTLEGTMKAIPGDYIIKRVKVELYPCKPDAFEKLTSQSQCSQKTCESVPTMMR